MDSDMELLEGDWADGDDEADLEDETGELPPSHARWARLSQWVQAEVEAMYTHRYEVPRDPIPRGPSYLQHTLLTLKSAREDLFREQLRVTPETFDAIVEKISNDCVFQNDSQHPQMPVEQQLAIVLFRFGHDGNASGLQVVANWAGVGKGTVSLVTRRVITAILRPSFMRKGVRFPTPAEKEQAKRWVHKHSCKAWRGGWCLVDGTLVPLYEKPSWFGESYYDRKCRYSLNIQVSSSVT